MIDKGGKSWFSGQEKQFVPREMNLWRRRGAGRVSNVTREESSSTICWNLLK